MRKEGGVAGQPPSCRPNLRHPTPTPCSATTLLIEQVERLMFELSEWRASPELMVG